MSHDPITHKARGNRQLDLAIPHSVQNDGLHPALKNGIPEFFFQAGFDAIPLTVVDRCVFPSRHPNYPCSQICYQRQQYLKISAVVTIADFSDINLTLVAFRLVRRPQIRHREKQTARKTNSAKNIELNSM